MDLKEIVFRGDKYPISQDEALFVIREYVKARKGVDIIPTPNKQFGMAYYARELSLMSNMATQAISWFRTNLK